MLRAEPLPYYPKIIGPSGAHGSAAWPTWPPRPSRRTGPGARPDPVPRVVLACLSSFLRNCKTHRGKMGILMYLDFPGPPKILKATTLQVRPMYSCPALTSSILLTGLHFLECMDSLFRHVSTLQRQSCDGVQWSDGCKGWVSLLEDTSSKRDPACSAIGTQLLFVPFAC